MQEAVAEEHTAFAYMCEESVFIVLPMTALSGMVHNERLNGELHSAVNWVCAGKQSIRIAITGELQLRKRDRDREKVVRSECSVGTVAMWTVVSGLH